MQVINVMLPNIFEGLFQVMDRKLKKLQFQFQCRHKSMIKSDQIKMDALESNHWCKVQGKSRLLRKQRNHSKIIITMGISNTCGSNGENPFRLVAHYRRIFEKTTYNAWKSQRLKHLWQP